MFLLLAAMQGKWSSSIYHPPDDSSWRDRDVFPLPVFEVTDVVNTTLSRTVRRRLLKKQWRLKRVNHAILALNSLFSGEPFDSPCKVCSSLDALPLVKADALRRIFEAVNSLGDCPPDASCQGAIDALRATSTAYCEPEPGVGDVVAMKLSAMSLPSGLRDGVDMLATFESPTREVVENFEDQMLQDASEWSHICETAASLKPYNDPSLHCRRQYVKFLGRLFDSGVLGFTEHCRGRVGAFCVSKKPKVVSGVRHERQRLVLDCRQTNLQFRPPPFTELGSLSSIAEMYLPEGKNLWMAGADIRDCFYAVNLPKGMENFFCLKSDVTRAEMHHITKGRFSIEFFGNTIIPCVKVLPMGFNWSFYLVQKLHEQLARNSLGIPRSSVFLDGHPPPMLQGEDVGTMPYCDNVHVLSLQQDACQTGKDEVCSSLELAGFDLHEHEDATTLFPTLGGIVDGKAGEVRATPKRMWTLIFIFNFMAHAVIDADFVQRVLGHAMVVCTLNRGGMSIFRRLYDFVAKGGPPRRLNGGERRECLVFAGLVPMLVAHLRTPWSSTITCTDASPAGFGICETEQSPEMVEALGRWQERWRFKRLPPEQWAPRQRYAGLNPLGDVRTVVDSSGQFDWANQFYEDGDFPEVGVGLMVSDNWKTVAMGKWSHTDEHITLKEARALLLAVRRISRASRHRGRRHVILVDNLALAFAVAKGRSQSFPILRVLQKIHAISLAAGIIVRIRWVPSEHNVSDGPSRGQIQPGPYIASFGRNGYEEEGASEDARVSKESRQKSAAKADEEFGTCSSEAEHWEEQEESDQGRTEKDAESHFGCEWKATKNASVCAGADCGAPAGNQSQEEPVDTVGGEEYQQRGRTSIQGILPTVSGLLQGERFALSTSQGDRCQLGGLYGHPVSRRARGKPGRENHRGGGIPLHQAQRHFGPIAKGIKRLAKSGPSTVKAALTKASGIWDGYADGVFGTSRNGIGNFDQFRCLPPPRRVQRPSCKERGSAGQEGGAAVPVLHSGGQGHRGWKARQGGRVRQFNTVEPSSTPVAGRISASVGPDPFSPIPKVVQLQDGGVQKDLHSDRCKDGTRHSPSISIAPWRCIRGSMCGHSGSQHSEVSRTMEDRSVCAEVCQGGKGAAALSQAVPGPPRILPLGSEQHGAGIPGSLSPQAAAIEWRDVFTDVHRPSRFSLEIFAGSARLSAAMRRTGIAIYPIDTCLFPSHNVLAGNLEERILSWIRSGRIEFVWLGMPCTTFSQARTWDSLGPVPLRTWQQLWGRSGLNVYDRTKLKNGNALLFFTLRIFAACCHYNVPVALENPKTSFAWSMPPLLDICLQIWLLQRGVGFLHVRRTLEETHQDPLSQF